MMKKILLAVFIINSLFLISCQGDGKSPMQKKMEEAAKRNEEFKKAEEAKKNEKPKWKKEEEKALAPVFVSIKDGDLSKLKSLIGSGTDINTKDDRQKTLLMAAAAAGNKDMVEFLLSKNADVNAKRVDGDTALMAAARSKNIDVFKLLIEKGADPLVKDTFGKTVLMDGASGGNKEIVSTLLKKGADVNNQDKFERTALVYAMKNKHFNIAKLLLGKGTKLRPKKIKPAKPVKIDEENPFKPLVNKRRKSALLYAVESGNLDMVKLLIKKGAPVLIENLSRFKEIREKRKGKEMVQEVWTKEEVEEFTDFDKDRKNILMYAAEGGHFDILKYLVKKGAKIEELDGESLRHPLFYVVMSEKGSAEKEKKLAEVTEFLVDKGEELFKVKKFMSEKEIKEAKSKNAAKSWFEEKDKFYKIEEKKKINLEEYDYEGWTVLTQAAMNGHYGVVKVLLDKGVMINRKERKYGRTALIYATTEKYSDIEKLLKDRGAKEGLNFDAEEDAKKKAAAKEAAEMAKKGKKK